MNKNKKISVLFLVIISIIITVCIAMFLLDTTGKVNQGNFRINDMIINSYAKVNEQESDQEQIQLSDLVFDLSQNNKISILVAKNLEAQRIYLDNFSYDFPEKMGQVILYQTDSNTSYPLNDLPEEIELNKIEQDEQYFIELNIDNVDFMTDVNAPENMQKITFDGTFLKDLNIKSSELNMKFSCDLNIIDVTGKHSKCKLKFNFPTDDLLNNGVSILRQDISKFPFILK